jgi:hypothetical protein
MPTAPVLEYLILTNVICVDLLMAIAEDGRFLMPESVSFGSFARCTLDRRCAEPDEADKADEDGCFLAADGRLKTDMSPPVMSSSSDVMGAMAIAS